MMRRTRFTGPLVYIPKRLITGAEIQPGLEGLYAAVPNKKYKGHTFTIKYTYPVVSESGETVYRMITRQITDWQHEAVLFRRFPDQWGNGTYTLAYYKMAETL